MPESNVDLSAVHATLDDTQTLNELFPAEPATAMATTVPSTPATGTTTAPAAPTTPAQPDEPFLKGNESVYKTREAAQRGLDEKDALIKQLRQSYSLATGVDTITKQPINAIAPQGNESYVLNPKKYVADLQEAKSPEQLAKVQQKFVFDTFQPIAPAISSMTKNAAIKQVADALPDFGTFYGSAEYKSTLEANPDLREAVEMAESDIAFHPRLAGLLKLTYLTNKGMQLPELLKKAAAPQIPQTPTRTTLTSSTPSPTEYTTSNEAPSLNSKAGRKAIIEQFEKSGAQNKIW
jgi:hypothetical protein